MLTKNDTAGFLINSFLTMLCAPEHEDVAATNQLVRPAFGMVSIE